MKQVLVTGSIILFLLTSCGEESDADAYESGVYYNPRIVVYEKDCSDYDNDKSRYGNLNMQDIPTGWLWFLPYHYSKHSESLELAVRDYALCVGDNEDKHPITFPEGSKSRLVVAYPE